MEKIIVEKLKTGPSDTTGCKGGKGVGTRSAKPVIERLRRKNEGNSVKHGNTEGGECCF